MQVSKWGNSLAVRLPKALVEELGLTPGDELQVVSATTKRITIARDERRALAVDRMRARGCRHRRTLAARRGTASLDAAHADCERCRSSAKSRNCFPRAEVPLPIHVDEERAVSMFGRVVARDASCELIGTGPRATPDPGDKASVPLP